MSLSNKCFICKSGKNFQSLLTNKVYGDLVNSFKYKELKERFEILKELYDNDPEDIPWEIRSDDPMADMMRWVGSKGESAYFTFFVKGTTVNEDGSFKLHPNISKCLGVFGIGTDERL